VKKISNKRNLLKEKRTLTFIKTKKIIENKNKMNQQMKRLRKEKRGNKNVQKDNKAVNKIIAMKNPNNLNKK